MQSVMAYGSETWAMKLDYTLRLKRNEMTMIRWMCGVTLKDRRSNLELLQRLGIDGIAEVVRRGRLRWFGHVERRDAGDWVSSCRNFVVVGQRESGRGRKTWDECVRDDLKKLKLRREEALDRDVWRGDILGERLTRASTVKTDVKCK